MASQNFPRLLQAMQQVGRLVQQHWRELAGQMLQTPLERTAYLRGFAPDAPAVVEEGDSMQTVVRNTSPQAAAVERGHGAYHLPSRVNWAQSPAVRRTRRGGFYLIIPFRHYSAQRGIRARAGSAAARRQMLARAVYEVARRLQPGQHLTAGASRGRAVHAPGLTPYVPRMPENVRPGYTHAAAQERLQRFPSGTGGRGQFLTFRTMRPDSPGWWIPAQPPRPIAAQTVRETTPAVRQLLETAASADVEALVAAQLKGSA